MKRRCQQSLFQCRTSGISDANWLDGNRVRGTAQWNDQELIIETWVQLGARNMHFRDYWSLADDGQTLLMEHRDDDLTGQLTVLDRQTQPSFHGGIPVVTCPP